MNRTHTASRHTIKNDDPRFSPLAPEDRLSPDHYPDLGNISAAFYFRFMPRPLESKKPEFVYVQLRPHSATRDEATRIQVAVSEWNLAWEAAELRLDLFENKLPSKLAWINRYPDLNLYLLPLNGNHHYHAYTPLYHLLPRHIVERFGLPCLKRGLWPFLTDFQDLDPYLPADFDSRLARAFASYIWRFIDSGSPLSAFSNSDSLKLLAHNLDFWLPYAVRVAEDRLRDLGRVAIEDEDQARELERVRSDLPEGYAIDRPLFGGQIWSGEEDALEATREMIDIADADGKLRSIIDAVKSNRVEDDFSPRWSYAREDFERRLYHKRNKVQVRFVELSDTIPIQGPDAEVDGNLVFEDFLALLDSRERQIVILIRSGVTGVGEISKILGYQNHSPVSKALAKIRKKAAAYLE